VILLSPSNFHISFIISRECCNPLRQPAVANHGVTPAIRCCIYGDNYSRRVCGNAIVFPSLFASRRLLQMLFSSFTRALVNFQVFFFTFNVARSVELWRFRYRRFCMYRAACINSPGDRDRLTGNPARKQIS